MANTICPHEVVDISPSSFNKDIHGELDSIFNEYAKKKSSDKIYTDQDILNIFQQFTTNLVSHGSIPQSERLTKFAVQCLTQKKSDCFVLHLLTNAIFNCTHTYMIQKYPVGLGNVLKRLHSETGSSKPHHQKYEKLYKALKNENKLLGLKKFLLHLNDLRKNEDFKKHFNENFGHFEKKVRLLVKDQDTIKQHIKTTLIETLQSDVERQQWHKDEFLPLYRNLHEIEKLTWEETEKDSFSLIAPSEVMRSLFASNVIQMNALAVGDINLLKDKKFTKIKDPSKFLFTLFQHITSQVPSQNPGADKLLEIINQYLELETTEITNEELEQHKQRAKKALSKKKGKLPASEYKDQLQHKTKALVIQTRVSQIYDTFPLLRLLPALTINAFSKANTLLKQNNLFREVYKPGYEANNQAPYYQATDKEFGTRASISYSDNEFHVKQTKKSILYKRVQDKAEPETLGSFKLSWNLSLKDNQWAGRLTLPKLEISDYAAIEDKKALTTAFAGLL